MNTQEVVKRLKKLNKPYIGIMPQSTYSNTIRAIEAGTCKEKTIKEFMKRFGYDKIETQWRKL